MGILMLGVGRYEELISDIIIFQKEVRKDKWANYLADLKEVFMRKGMIKTNPNRAKSYSRDFLASERQIMFKLKVILKKDNNYFFKGEGLRFDQKRINKLLNEYYKIYGSLNDEAA